MNHMRFHSWCPPAAAFRMQTSCVYLEVEMPMWGKDAQPMRSAGNFFRRELRGILKEYGNHPSFILYCSEQKLPARFGFMKSLPPRPASWITAVLTAVPQPRTRVKSDQFYITHQTTKDMAIYEGRPYTNWD